MNQAESAIDAPVRGEHSGSFLRLDQLWRNASQFSLLLAVADDSSYRDALIAHLQALTPAPRVNLTPADSPQDWLRQLAQVRSTGATRVHVCLPISPRRPDNWWHRANVLRERLADAFPAIQLLWMSDDDVGAAAHHAPDLWNWRGAVFGFSTMEEPVILGAPAVLGSRFDRSGGADSAVIAERLARVLHRLDSNVGDAGSAHLWFEAAQAHERLGDWPAAQVATQQAALAFGNAGNDAGKAQAVALEAELQWLRGDPSKALQKLRTEVLPVFERLGDVRSKAVILGQIADILQATGQLDQALRIRTEEQLPVYERLGDLRERAVTLGQIADILQARGQLDEALRIHREEELPVYERLSDVRSKATVLGQIASILKVRGQLDEALRMLGEEVLPAFERLGDVREKAVTMGRIADILQARGQLDEALRIRNDEQLPVYERLGDVRSKAITLYKIADLIASKGQSAQALNLLEVQVLPILAQMSLTRETEITRARIAALRLSV